jgi:hypothetical protein
MNARNAYIVGMEGMQYTIRGILPWMDERLRAKTKREGKTFNAVPVEILMHDLSPNNPEPEFHNMDDLIGSWVHGPDMDEALASMDAVSGYSPVAMPSVLCRPTVPAGIASRAGCGFRLRWCGLLLPCRRGYGFRIGPLPPGPEGP